MRTLTLTLVLLTVANDVMAQARTTQAPVYVTAIEVVADVRDRSDKVPRGLTPSDFILLEEGIEQRIIAVDYLRSDAPPATADASVSQPNAPLDGGSSPGEWQFVAYFETLLSSARTRQAAAEALIPRVDWLAARGTVDVVLAAPTPKALVRNSRDPEAIRRALQTVAAHGGVNQLTTHRREFYRESQALAGLQAVADVSRDTFVESGFGRQRLPTNDASFADAPVTFETAVVRPYIDAEVQLVSHFRNGLLTWLSSYRRHTPRVLLMVIDGFDTNPLDYYLSNLPKKEQITLRASITSTGLGDLTQELADALASGSWITVSIPTDEVGGWVDDTSFPGLGRAHGLTRRAMSPKGVLFGPVEPLNEIAVATGGRVAKGVEGVGQLIDSLDERIRITYQVSRRPDGKPRKIELRARDRNLNVRAARWAASSTPEEIAETRALRLLREKAFGGDLPVESSVEWAETVGRRNGTLRASAKLDLVNNVLPAGARGEFRFTLAVLRPPNRATVVNRVVGDYDISRGTFQVWTPIDMPADASRMVVVIEEAATGLWGSARLEIVRK